MDPPNITKTTNLNFDSEIFDQKINMPYDICDDFFKDLFKDFSTENEAAAEDQISKEIERKTLDNNASSSESDTEAVDKPSTPVIGQVSIMIKNLKQQNKELKELSLHQENELAKYEERLSEKMEEVLQIQMERDLLKEDLETLKTENTFLKSKLEEKEAELKQFKGLIQQKNSDEEEIKQLQKDLQSETKKFKKAERDVQRLNEAVLKKAELLNKLRKHNRKLAALFLEFGEILKQRGLLNKKYLKYVTTIEEQIENKGFGFFDIESFQEIEDIWDVVDEHLTVSPINNKNLHNNVTNGFINGNSPDKSSLDGSYCTEKLSNGWHYPSLDSSPKQNSSPISSLKTKEEKDSSEKYASDSEKLDRDITDNLCYSDTINGNHYKESDSHFMCAKLKKAQTDIRFLKTFRKSLAETVEINSSLLFSEHFDDEDLIEVLNKLALKQEYRTPLSPLPASPVIFDYLDVNKETHKLKNGTILNHSYSKDVYTSVPVVVSALLPEGNDSNNVNMESLETKHPNMNSEDSNPKCDITQNSFDSNVNKLVGDKSTREDQQLSISKKEAVIPDKLCEEEKQSLPSLTKINESDKVKINNDLMSDYRLDVEEQKVPKAIESNDKNEYDKIVLPESKNSSISRNDKISSSKISQKIEDKKTRLEVEDNKCISFVIEPECKSDEAIQKSIREKYELIQKSETADKLEFVSDGNHMLDDLLEDEECNNYTNGNISDDEVPLVIAEDPAEEQIDVPPKLEKVVENKQTSKDTNKNSRKKKKSKKKRSSNAAGNVKKKVKFEENVNNSHNLSNDNNHNLLSVFEDIENLKFDDSHFKLHIHTLVNALINPANALSSSSVIFHIAKYLSLSRRTPMMAFSISHDSATLLPLIEKCIVMSLVQTDLKMKPQFKNLLTCSINSLYLLVLAKGNIPIYGLSAFCRVFTELCKHTENSKKPISLCCELLKIKHRYSSYLVASIVSIWNDIFFVSDDMSDVELMFFSAIVYGLHKKKNQELTESQWKHCQLIISKFMKAQSISDVSSATNSIIEMIESVLDEDPFEEEFMLIDPLVIFSAFEGWDWTKENLLENFILPSLSKYAQTTKNSRAFLLFCELFCEIGLAQSNQEEPIEILSKYFYLGEQGFDYVRHTAACSLIKFFLLKNQDVPDILSEWFEENQNNLDSDTELLLRRRIIADSSELTEDDIV